MTYFQNPFAQEFQGVLSLADRHLNPTWKVPANLNDSHLMMAWNLPPYNLTGNTDLTINYSIAPTPNNIHKDFAALTIDITTAAASVSAVTVPEIVEALNSNTTFSSLFEAFADIDRREDTRLRIRSKQPRERFKVFISNSSAESVLRFNRRAGVAEMPSFFARHTIANARNFDDSQAHLVELDPGGSAIDAAIVTDAGFSTTVRADWELLEGKSGLFQFTIVDPTTAASSSTDTIIYHAGMQVGDFAKKIVEEFDGSGDLLRKFELPHVLTASDIVSPP